MGQRMNGLVIEHRKTWQRMARIVTNWVMERERMNGTAANGASFHEWGTGMIVSRPMFIALLIVITATAMLVGLRPAQAGEGVAVSVRLRDAGGAPLVAEPLTLVAFREPATAADGCLTDGDGRCTWRVAPGLYELLARRPLDDVTQATTAEGGLRGPGVTVGATPIRRADWRSCV